MNKINSFKQPVSHETWRLASIATLPLARKKKKKENKEKK